MGFKTLEVEITPQRGVQTEKRREPKLKPRRTPFVGDWIQKEEGKKLNKNEPRSCDLRG